MIHRCIWLIIRCWSLNGDDEEIESWSLNGDELLNLEVWIAHLSLPWSFGWVALSFLVCRLFVRPAMVTSDQISTFFNMYRHKSPLLPHTTTVPPNTNQYCLLLTQYHQVPSSTALYWPITIIYQPVPPQNDPISPRTSQYRTILTQHLQSSCINQYRPIHLTPHWRRAFQIFCFQTQLPDLPLSTWDEHSCTLLTSLA